jgi:hypothetical protein
MTPFELMDVLIGLALVYLVMAVLCSGVNEMLAQKFSRRGRFLREGLMNMLGDRSTYLQLVNHSIVASFYRDVPGKPRNPSYLPPAHFAQALFDVMRMKAAVIQAPLEDGDGKPLANKDALVAQALAGRDAEPLTLENLRRAAIVCRDYGYPAAAALVPLLDGANGNLATAQKNVEDWFDSTMDRVSGWYKLHAQKTLLAIGIVAAVLLNVDSIEILRRLAASDQLRTSLAATAAKVVETRQIGGVSVPVAAGDRNLDEKELREFAAGLKSLQDQGLPVGFACLAQADADLRQVAGDCLAKLKALKTDSWFLKILGWLITAFAVTLGAPYWFDLLGKLISLRGGGPKPVKSAKS